MSMSSKRKSKFGGHCAVLPASENQLSNDLFDVDGTSIIYPSEECDAVNKWDFDGVFNGPKDFIDSYKTVVYPLVQHVERGENAMVIFAGAPFMDPMEYLASRNGRQGFLSQSADRLIRSAVHNDQKLAAITFSWFKVDCSAAEAITDLLRVASTPATGKGPDPNLVLREVGRGKGMFVSGLWEVELATSSDIEAVISHVTKLVPGSIHNGASHSVFQLTMTPSKATSGPAHVIGEDLTPSRLTFVVLSSLAPLSNIVGVDHHQTATAHTLSSSTNVNPWVDLLSELLLWMHARRPSPPFHKSRILLLLRDAICGRMPSNMYFLMQPTTSALAENSLWLQICSRIREIVSNRTNSLSESSRVQGAPDSPGPVVVQPPVLSSSSPSFNGAPISGSLMYPAILSQPEHEEVVNNQEENNDFQVNNQQDNMFEDPEEEISFEAIRRRSAEISKRQQHQTSDCPDAQPSTWDFDFPEMGRQNYNYGRDDQLEDEPFQYLPSPPPPGPPVANEESYFQPSQRYVNPFDEILAARGLQSNAQSRQQTPTRRHTVSDAATIARDTLSTRQHEVYYRDLNETENQRDLNAPSQRTELTGRTDILIKDNRSSRNGSQTTSNQNSGTSSYQTAKPSHSDSSTQRGVGAPFNNPAGATARRYSKSIEVTMGTLKDKPPPDDREDLADRQNKKVKSDDNLNSTLPGFDPSDLEALLEALHKSREENKALTNALESAENRCAKLTRDYERLVAKVQEEGYFLRTKEREKFKKVLQDLKDYEVYKQVMETAMSKMQSELDAVLKENKALKEENVVYERTSRKHKTDGFKTHKQLEDALRDSSQKSELIKDLQDKLSVRSRERDSAVETFSAYKLKASNKEGELSARLKIQTEDIKALTAKLEEVHARLAACESEKATLETNSKQEVEKFRSAHLAALDKCMGYQEENDLLRASLAEIIEAQEQSLLNEEMEQSSGRG